MRDYLARRYGTFPLDHRIDEIIENDYLRNLYYATLKEVKTSEEILIDILLTTYPELLKNIADRVGTAALVGPLNSLSNRPLKEPMLSMESLYKPAAAPQNTLRMGNVIINY